MVNRSVLPHLGLDELEHEAREPRLVGVRLQNGREWTVGREWGWEGMGSTLLDRLPRHVQESFAYHSAWALREQEPFHLFLWGYDYRDEIAAAAGVSRCDVRAALDDLHTREMQPFLPRDAITLTLMDKLRNLFPAGSPSRRRLWAALDGTISAAW